MKRGSLTRKNQCVKGHEPRATAHTNNDQRMRVGIHADGGLGNGKQWAMRRTQWAMRGALGARLGIDSLAYWQPVRGAKEWRVNSIVNSLCACE